LQAGRVDTPARFDDERHKVRLVAVRLRLLAVVERCRLAWDCVSALADAAETPPVKHEVTWSAVVVVAVAVAVNVTVVGARGTAAILPPLSRSLCVHMHPSNIRPPSSLVDVLALRRGGQGSRYVLAETLCAAAADVAAWLVCGSLSRISRRWVCHTYILAS
jgi:hypothetical protein